MYSRTAIIPVLQMLWIAACGGTPEVVVPTAAPTAALEVVNQTADSWDLRAGGLARGTLAPHSAMAIDGLPVGSVSLTASNKALELSQSGQLDLVAGQTNRWEIRPQSARLIVINPRDSAVEILIDGSVIGQAAAQSETTFDVPAGKRTLIGRALRGPGTVQAERYFGEGSDTRWAFPHLADVGAASAAPKPPPGQGLIWMHNRSSNGVVVVIGGVVVARAATGDTVSIVVPPGTHVLKVRLEGVDATSEHTVTLSANQVAEWEYGVR